MKRRIFSALLAMVMCIGLYTPVSATETGDSAGAVTQDPLLTEQEPVVAFAAASAARQTQNFNYDWKFYLGDVKGGEAKGFDDSDWRGLNLPHDWSIELDFNKNSAAGFNGGFLDGGVGWYRKTFVLPATMAGKEISIAFGGVYMDSTTYVNGTMVGNYPYGYSPFAYDITNLVVADGVTKNVVAVKVNHQQASSRWYSGSGIYRNVDLVITEPVHVARYGTFVTTPDLEAEYANNRAVVNVKTAIENNGDTDAEVTVKSTIYDAEGIVFAETAATEAQTTAMGAVTEFEQNITTAKPKLWGVDTPNLYTLVTEVVVDEFVTDRYETTFGFRWIEMTPNDGFSLNNEYMKLNGVCMHHDQGALGAVANERAIERQMQMMKDMGVNSIRVTHNPAADELLEICNRMGLLVIDEAFDCWEQGKRTYDYGRFFNKAATHPDAKPGQTWAEFDIKNMVERGKNDPCIIMWSIGNEIVGASVPTATKLNNWVKEVDTTRLTTQGYNTFIDGFDKDSGNAKVAAVTDVAGFNYGEKNATFDKAHSQLPDWIIMGSETSSAVRSRGFYKSRALDKNICTSYDEEMVGWGSSLEKSWQRNRDRKWILGEYMWTGFDYIGEPSPYNGWPSKNSFFGAVDTAGIPKDAFYMYQSVWTDVEENPMVHLLPHWNWEGDAGYDIKDKDGKIRVQAYTNAASVELYHNGNLVSKQEFDQLKTNYDMPYQEKNGHIYLEWKVPYVPGELKAIAYDLEGNKVAEDIIKTSGAPAQIRLTPDREVITADGLDLSYILVEVLDKDGNLVPTADNLVNFQVSGSGIIAGVDNGDQNAVDERYKDNKRKAFSGKAMLIIQSTTEAGPISVTATSAGLASDKVTIFTNADQSGEAVLLGYEAIADVKTALNTPPELPETISAVYSDGHRNPMAVTWDAISDDRLSALGLFSLKGTVDETGDKVAVTVIVVGALGLQEISLVTPTGTIPALPAAVTAVYNTGETEQVDVQWERELAAEDVEAPGTITIAGTVQGFNEKAKLTIYVKNGTVSYVTDIAKKDGTYPIPTASYVGGDPISAINDGGVYYSSGPNGGRWIPWGHNQSSEWCQLELETARIIGKAGVDIWNNTSDDKMSLPDELTVQLSMTGQEGSWTDAASLTRDEIDNADGVMDSKATERVYLDFSDTPITAKFIRWKFDNAALKSTGVSEVHVYEQSVEIPVEPGAKLAEIKVDGEMLEGFDPDVTSYVYPLPYGAEVPQVTAKAQGNATLFVTPALDNNKATTIIVNSEDGQNTSYYTVQFQEAAPALETVEISLGGTELVEDDVLPITLTATMQDGTVLTPGVIDVVYTVGDNSVAKVENGTLYAYREGSTTLKAAVTYHDVTVESALLRLTIAPNVAGKTVTGYEQVTVTTEKGVAPQLPAEITATFDVGLPKTVPVRWDSINAEKYADYGSFTVKGTVDGQSLRPTATVQVKGIVGVQQFSAATPVRFVPELPTKARVLYSDGTAGELPVTWEDCAPEKFGTATDVVTVNGTVDADGRELSTAITVRVSSNTRFGDTFTQYKNGFYLPLPFASYSNLEGTPKNGADKIYDGVLVSDQSGSGQNCWNNWASTARAEDYVGFVFGLEEVVNKPLDQLDIYFYSDSGIAAPASCEIQYYTGERFDRGDIAQYPVDKLPSEHLLADDANWTTVENMQAPETLTAHAKNTFTFDAVSACAIRVKMTAQSDKSVGIIEMQAHAKLVDDISNQTVLTGIALNGVPLEGFAPETTEYTHTVEGTALPEITATAGENNESVTVVTANTAKVIVTAEDGVTTKTYTITFERPDLPPEGSKTYAELQTLIAEAEKLLEDGVYTAVSADALRAAVDTAKELTADAPLDNTTAQYTALQDAINALVLAPGKKIVSFTLPGQYGRTVIDERESTITITVAQGTDMTALAPTIKVSEDATVDPASGAEQDFTKPVVYTVTASDGAARSYTVTVTVYAPPYTPPSGGGNNNTVTEKNPDGSTTKTVTDKKTGNVTETTTYPDGTKIVATTPKDGATTIEVTVPKDKEKATVTIPTAEQPKPGEVAVIIHEDGTREVIKTSVSTKDGLRVTLTGNAKLEIVDNSKSFADVPADHWGADAIAFVTSRELFNGGDSGFQPAGDMNRAMLFTVLARLDGQDLTGGETWYENAMLWAKDSGVSDGTSPEAAISREQLAVMLYRYAKAEKTEAELKDFSDAGSVSDWAAEAMAWAVKSGIITGKNGALDPQGNATRAEVATMLMRFISQ